MKTFTNSAALAQALAAVEIEQPKATSSSPRKGEPVQEAHLRRILGYIDAGMTHLDRGKRRKLWRDITAAINNTNIEGDDDGSIRLAIADEWSSGKLDRQGRYKDTPPANYEGLDDVRDIFNTMLPKEDGVGYGAIYHAAKEAGYTGAPARPSASEVFAHVVASLPQLKISTALQAVLLAELLARPVLPVEEIIAGLVEKGIMTMLSGPGGRHKSRLLLQWLLCIAAGVKIFGRSVIPATCIYLSSEDHADEVARRVQAIVKQLNLPHDIPFQYHDLTLCGKPLAIITENGGVEIQPFYAELRTYLLAIPGHKVLGLDSCYNFLHFQGKTKIDEGSVKQALELLNRLCAETNTTIIMLWHPSQAGQERGDASGWSVAWHNTPRARLSLSDAKDGSGGVIKDAFKLTVEKRNNAAKGDPITLHWNNGALLPSADLDVDKQGARLLDACVEVAIMAAENGQPLQRQKHPVEWVIMEIEKRAGFRPTKHRIKEELATAMSLGRLRYLNGTRHRTAGYYPPDIREATDLAHKVKNSATHTAPGEGETVE